MQTKPTSRSLLSLAPFLFFSGLCALIYQICWLREFRLIFGASTAASAAVVAIFIGGLGAGGIIIGQRADRHQKPLALYARLEIMIAIAAALSPIFLSLIRWIYLSVGGSNTLGLTGGTILRLILASLVLGVPTFLMGGTLPAATRAIATEEDRGRSIVAWLYAINTLGAVLGAALATFYLIERNGTRLTLWLAAAANLLLGIGVLIVARKTAALPENMKAPRPTAPAESQATPAWFILVAAAIVGFAFFLMEIVWYRMLSPILGGSVFTFGLILCAVLLGIGLGGLLYAFTNRKRAATLSGFAFTCLLEAGFVMLAYALGDSIAWVAASLQSFTAFGFGGLVFSWAIITAIAVVPAGIVAGYQFPMLIALLGKGRTDVGRHVGAAYAWNTAGAIVGSLAGGFVLLPILTAPGCWQMVGILLAILGVWTIVMQLRQTRRWITAIAPLAMACVVLILTLVPDGPTAAWRHSGIGVGRAKFSSKPSPNEYREWVNLQRYWTIKEMEGVESCIGINTRGGLAFIVNGKADGNAWGDAPTQVMLGVLPALLHPQPRSAAVVGLGTGSTAGWLAAIGSIERVDVIELEPAVLEFARMCTHVNADAMNNPKLHITIGDAREYLMTTRSRYDLIISEPSNPYRAGVASLFTREYYKSIDSRLEDGGIFVQWVQSYDVHTSTIQTICATALSVFPSVEIWQGAAGDLLLLGSRRPLDHDIARLTTRMRQEPFRTALSATWRAVDIQGFYSHFIANSQFVKAFSTSPDIELNTDDRTVIEFGFARGINLPTRFSIAGLRSAAGAVQQHHPAITSGAVDWNRVEDEIALFAVFEGFYPQQGWERTPGQRQRAITLRKYVDGDYSAALAAWLAQPAEPRGPTELTIVAECLASRGDERALKYIDQLRAFQPAEADAVLARFHLVTGQRHEAAADLIAAFARLQRDPWAMRIPLQRALTMSADIAKAEPATSRPLYNAIRRPFAVYAQEELRRQCLVQIAGQSGELKLLMEVMKENEPFVPWTADYLTARLQVYIAAKAPLQGQALAELLEFRKARGETNLKPEMLLYPTNEAPPSPDQGRATVRLE
jgi:spermidine synthase